MDDAWFAILSHIDCGSDYKAVYQVDKLRRNLAIRVHPTADTKFANQLTTLLTMIDRDEYLPAEFETKWQFMDFFTQYGCNYKPCVTADFVRSHPHWPWGCGILNFCDDITTDILEDNDKFITRKSEVDPWGRFSSNKCITFEYVLANLEREWDWKSLSQHPNITPNDIDANPDLPWDYGYVACNRNLTWDFITRHLDDFGEETYWISALPCVTIDLVRDHPDFPWSWWFLSANINITPEIIRNNPDLPWELESLDRNRNITVEDVKNNPRISWECVALTEHANMTYEIIIANPDLPWYLNRVWVNPNITLEIVEAHPEGINGHPWVILAMRIKPGLTWKKIIELDGKGMIQWL